MTYFKIGFDMNFWSEMGISVPISAPVGHLIVVGGSGSGKSTGVLYFIRNILKSGIPVKFYICDFKASKEFDGISEYFSEYEACYDRIKEFYEVFMRTPEKNEEIKILIIDEISGLLTHFEMSKETKPKADEIRRMMSSILMLGRSRNVFLWLSMQRYSASIFPASSGSADNFHVCVGLGRLTVDGRKGLFAGEHLENEDRILFGVGSGIVLIDGKPLQALILPRLDKEKLLRAIKIAKG